MDCGPTLDIGDFLDEEDGAEDIDGETESQTLWGRLFPLGKGLTGIGKPVLTDTLQYIIVLFCFGLDLYKDEYTFGRADDCDYCFEQRGGRSNPHFRTFSNVHFRIFRVRNGYIEGK